MVLWLTTPLVVGVLTLSVCSCGHWTWDDLLAKRKWLCVGCQNICDPYGHSTQDRNYPIGFNGSGMALADDPNGGDGGAKPKGRWRRHAQEQAPQETTINLSPVAPAALRQAAGQLSQPEAQMLLAPFKPSAPAAAPVSAFH